MAIIEKIKEKIQEVFNPLEEKKEDIGLEDEDKSLLEKVKFRKDEAERYLNARKLDWEKNLKLFEGDHWQVAGVTLPSYKADIVVNKFFAAVRSLVAFETDAKPDPEVEARIDMSDPTAGEVTASAKKVESMLDYRWDVAQIPSILTETYYDRYIFDDGFGMYFWDIEIDDVNFEQVKPHELMVAPGATCVEDAEYLIVQKWRNKKWFQDFYPDVDIDEIKFEEITPETQIYQGIPQLKSGEYANMAKVYHYFEDEIWVTFTDDLILEKQQNPYWEFRSEVEQREELIKQIGEPPVDWQPIKNHLQKPEKPIIHFKGYHLGGDFYSKSLVKQVAKLNFAINKRKCQIHDNADNASGQWLIDPSVPLDKVNMITSEPGLKIRINPSLASKVAGTPLPEQVYLDLQDTQRAFDDMMGHHEISRGAQASKRQTAREAMLLRETDITPVRLLMRNSEVAITKLLNGWVQLMRLFYDTPHYIGKFGVSFREEAGKALRREEIPDKLSIIIKVGSTLPTSKEQKRMEYQADLARGVLDPLTYLELMNYPNPKKILQRVQNWQQGIIGEEAPPTGVPTPPQGGLK